MGEGSSEFIKFNLRQLFRIKTLNCERSQEPEKYVHFPPSGLEKEQASNPEFYQPDELKYHGHRLQRGYTQINFFDEEKPTQTLASPHELNNECHGHWKTPRDCSVEKHDCEYFISWQTAGKGDEIRFHLETNNTNTWTGVAFSDNQQMVTPVDCKLVDWFLISFFFSVTN